MHIEHKANVFCIIIAANTPQGREKIGRGCWLYRAVEPGQVVQEFGYTFRALGEKMWIVIFVDSNSNQTASFFEENGLLTILDGNTPHNPDDVILRLEDKRKNKDGDNV